jgi:hypothetical protein
MKFFVRKRQKNKKKVYFLEVAMVCYKEQETRFLVLRSNHKPYPTIKHDIKYDVDLLVGIF